LGSESGNAVSVSSGFSIIFLSANERLYWPEKVKFAPLFVVGFVGHTSYQGLYLHDVGYYIGTHTSGGYAVATEHIVHIILIELSI